MLEVEDLLVKVSASALRVRVPSLPGLISGNPYTCSAFGDVHVAAGSFFTAAAVCAGTVGAKTNKRLNRRMSFDARALQIDVFISPPHAY
jgi:hypothetical protein